MWLRLRRHDTVLVIACLALGAKLLFAYLSQGSNDVGTFFRFGTFIRGHGLAAMYREDPEFNHLPLTGLLCAAAVPLPWFPFWIRLPGIVADLVTVKALLRFQQARDLVPWWSLALFAASPVSLLVSGFHGNVDSVMAMALVLSVIAVADDRPVASGIWLALAANIKVAALLMAPLIVLIWWHRRRNRSFLPVFAGLTLLGWLPALVVAPSEFVHQVLGYSSRWGTWGFTFLARRFGGDAMRTLPGFADLTSTQSLIVSVLKVLILAGVLVVAWRGRAANAGDVWRFAALTWAIFFVLAPGIGAQYLVWLAPFVLVAAPPAYAAITAASTVALLAFYGITSSWRFDFAHSTILVEDDWLPWTCLPWLAIIGFVISELVPSRPGAAAGAGSWTRRGTRRPGPGSPAAVPAPPSG
jgi:hypothetical protein